jgi:hypothetical protein
MDMPPETPFGEKEATFFSIEAKEIVGLLEN